MTQSNDPRRGLRTVGFTPARPFEPAVATLVKASAEPAICRPDRWAGEVDCRVGPFRSVSDAERFSNDLVDFGRFETIQQRVMVEDSHVFVEMTRL